jgi:hypothetical protein
MSKLWITVVLMSIGMQACAHHGAQKVECNGPLRPINRSDIPPPVTVEPAMAPPHDEGRQP